MPLDDDRFAGSLVGRHVTVSGDVSEMLGRKPMRLSG